MIFRMVAGDRYPTVRWMSAWSMVNRLVQTAKQTRLRPDPVSWAGSINTSMPGMPCRVLVTWTSTVWSISPLR